MTEWDKFKRILDVATQEQGREFISLIDGKGVVEYTKLIFIFSDDLKAFGLNSDIKFGLYRDLGGHCKMRYFYKGLELAPDADFINGSDMDTLQILQACIAQDTHTPKV